MNEKDNKLNKGNFLYIRGQDKAEWGYPKGYPYKVEEPILDGTFEFIYEDGIYMHIIVDENFGYIDGKSYTVIWDGEAYQCLDTNVDGDFILLGNAYLLNVNLADTGEPFLFLYNSNGLKGILTLDTAATHTITVYKEITHTMAPEFMPDPTLISPNGTKYKLSVSNDGTLSAVIIS